MSNTAASPNSGHTVTMFRSYAQISLWENFICLSDVVRHTDL